MLLEVLRVIKCVIEGEINTPAERTRKLKTIWIANIGQTEPRFVTARPIKPSHEEVSDGSKTES